MLPVLKWVEINASNFSYEYYLLHNIFASNQQIHLGGGKLNFCLTIKGLSVLGDGEIKGEVSIIKREKLKKSHCISITVEASQCNW